MEHEIMLPDPTLPAMALRGLTVFPGMCDPL